MLRLELLSGKKQKELFMTMNNKNIKKLREIKKDNPTANEDQLLLIAHNKGGTSIISAILFLIIYFIFAFSLAIFI